MSPGKYLLLFLLVLFSACTGKKHSHGFYHWKTSFPDADTIATPYIANWRLDQFYIHYFDVDWNEDLAMPVPVGGLDPRAYYNRKNSRPLLNGTVVPVVFITARTFERMGDAWVDSLAGKVNWRIHTITETLQSSYVEDSVNNFLDTHKYSWEKRRTLLDSLEARFHGDSLTAARDQLFATIERVTDSMKQVVGRSFQQKITEIQIDCDWTVKGRDKYFRFLREMKRSNPNIKISATIRLYPYKYFDKMGVPPVDRGMLMCYNLGNIASAGTGNSIFALSGLESYLTGKKYPLQLDVALPVFSWYAWFRNGRYLGIIHEGDALLKDSIAFKKVDQAHYRITTDTVISDNYYREGDELRAEAPDKKELERAADLLASKIPGFDRIVFFHWDNQSIKTYAPAVQNIFDRY